MLGVAESGVPEERADCGEPGVTGAHAIFALMLEMVEEGADKWGVEIADVQLRGLRAAQRRRKNQH